MSSKYFSIISLGLILFLSIGSCRKWDDYKKYQNGKEIVYPGIISNATASPGNNRVQLNWNPSIDPKTSKYIIYWNNGADSQILNISSHNPNDTTRVIVSNLPEMNQNFTVYTIDDAGNRSVPVGINNVRVYGNQFRSGLINRAFSSYDYDLPSGVLSLTFGKADTIYVGTEVTYTATSGETKNRFLTAGNDTLQIPDWKTATRLYYRSAYRPVSNAIDTFNMIKSDSLTVVVQAPVPRNLFAAINAPNDLAPYDGATGISNLWSGKVGPQGYPDIFHSNGATSMPGTITFDMGALYNNLSIIEETGRNCCHNPGEFEVWGIADATGAYPGLLPDDPQWSTQMTAKGWTLLTDAVRTDDGMNPMKFDLIPNPPPVRYIRIRFKSTVDNSNYVNLSQLSFWHRL